MRTLQVDVSDENAVNSAVDTVAREDERIDVLVHSAGITGPTRLTITEISTEDYDRVYRLNQRSTFLLVKRVLPNMVARNYGRVMIYASIAGKHGNPGMCAYSSTEAAVLGLVKGIGKEYAESGITGNAMAPAVMRFPMNVTMSPEQLKDMTDKFP